MVYKSSMMNRNVKHVQIRLRRLSLFSLVVMAMLAGVTRAAPAEDALTGVWVLSPSSIRISSTVTELRLNADGTMRAVRAARKQGDKLEPRLVFQGTWTREGKRIRFRTKQEGGKEIDLFLFKACDYSSKPNDLNYKQWISCGFITHYARQSSMRKAGERVRYMGEGVVLTGGIRKQAPVALKVREYPPEESPMKFCSVARVSKFPFHELKCLDRIPRGTVLRLIGRREDASGNPGSWYLIEFTDRFLSKELSKPFVRRRLGWVKYDLSRAPSPPVSGKGTSTADAPPPRRAPSFDAKSPLLGQWKQYTDGKNEQPATLVLRPNFTYQVSMKATANYKKQEYTARWKYKGRNIILMKPSGDGNPMASTLSGECSYKVRDQNLFYRIWLECPLFMKFTRAASRVPPGANKTFKGILEVVTIHGKTRPAPAGLEPRSIVLGEPLNFCYLDRRNAPSGTVGKITCGKAIPPGTTIRVIARSRRKGAYTGWPGYAYLIEFNAVLPGMHKPGTVIREEYEATAVLFRALVGAKLE